MNGDGDMKFKDFYYDRTACEALSTQLKKLIDDFEVSSNFEEQDKLIESINKVRTSILSMAEIVYIRNTMDTSNEYYNNEWDFIDDTTPDYEGAISKYYKLLTESKFRHQLEEKWEKQIFKIAEIKLKTFSEEIVEDLKHEYKLISEYNRLLASAKINLEDKEYNLAGIAPFMQSLDRNMRKRAAEAKYDFFKANENEFDRIFDEMVKVRTTIARKLGYKDFVQLGYDRMMRTYNSDMVSVFRDQIYNYIVPITTQLRKRQSRRLGLQDFKYYDESLAFTTGNAEPKGDLEWIITNAQRMFNELSPETAEFFDFMVENELMDLTTRKGKAVGAYSHYIGEYKSPFIFANFNSTSEDINSLVHESGHAFQAYLSNH